MFKNVKRTDNETFNPLIENRFFLKGQDSKLVRRFFSKTSNELIQKTINPLFYNDFQPIALVSAKLGPSGVHGRGAEASFSATASPLVRPSS